MNQPEKAIIVSNVSKTYSVLTKPLQSIRDVLFNIKKGNNKKNIYALKNIDFSVDKGTCIGIMGRNGSGKSTLTKIMSGSIQPNEGGTIERNGSHLLLNLGVGFSHELTARENIYVNGSTLGLRKKEIDLIYNDILEFADLTEFADTKIKYYSTGMIQRLSFSIAVYAKADILFLDEVFAVGDNIFREKATKMLEESWLKGSTTVLVTHSPALIKKYCKKVLVLNKGEQLYYGDVEEGLKVYNSL